jgi:soluble lytic murein transglycosylase
MTASSPSGDGRADDAAVPESAVASVLDDARLLASFGEARRAYLVSPSNDSHTGADVDRLDFEARLLTELGEYQHADSLLAGRVPLAEAGELSLYYLRRGKLNVMAGRFQRALDCLAATDTIPDDGYGVYRHLIRMEANAGLGRAADAVEAGRRALSGGIPRQLSPEFELAMVDALSLAGRLNEALGVIETLKRRARSAGQMASLLALEYELHFRADDLPSARSSAQKLGRAYGTTGEAESVSSDLLDRVPAGKLKNSELLAHAEVMTVHGRYREARALIRILDERALSNRQREERSIVKASYYYHTGDYRRAAALAKPHFSDRAYRRESMLILARCYRRTGQKKKAADVYSHFARVYPNDGKAAETLYVAAKLHERAGRIDAAQAALYRLRKSYPSSYFGRVASYSGSAHYSRVGDYDRSVAILNRALRRSRRTDEAALYYLADTYGKMGRTQDKTLLLKELERFDPYSFYLSPFVEHTFERPPTTSAGEVALYGDYGLLTFLYSVASRKEQARREVLAAVDKSIPRTPPDPEAAKCVERGRWFLDAGFRDWGEHELARASRMCFNSPAQLVELGRLHDMYGLPWNSIRLYQRVKDLIPWRERRAYAEQFRHLMYPVPFPVQVLENAARYDLPPHLVYAMIREESKFDQKAVSRVGALGLMQLMPETGRYVARELEVPEWVEENLLDPEINLAFGVWYASSLVDRAGGHYPQMLAAYNAGPGNAKRWFKGRSPEMSTIDIVDDIDFKETRLYVQRIVESANVYHSLYFDADDRPGTSAR